MSNTEKYLNQVWGYTDTTRNKSLLHFGTFCYIQDGQDHLFRLLYDQYNKPFVRYPLFPLSHSQIKIYNFLKQKILLHYGNTTRFSKTIYYLIPLIILLK